jgi:hypothetical protein
MKSDVAATCGALDSAPLPDSLQRRFDRDIRGARARLGFYTQEEGEGQTNLRGSGGKVRSQLVVGGEEVFGLDARFPDDRHEIGISCPAWEQVQVKMIGYAGARASSQIYTQIIPFRVIALS